MKYTELTDIQMQAMPLIFDEQDILGCAQTGTGKTATFSIPIINNILKEKERFKIRGLIVAPTRELALQIYDNIMSYCKYTNIRTLCILGGVKESYQKDKLSKGVDIVVATPGRLIDLIKQKHVNLKSLNYFVIDEVDKMFDMGFIFDIKKIISYIPVNRQTLLFSATINDNVKDLSKEILNDYKEVLIKENTSINTIIHNVYAIEQINKIYLLKDIIKYEKIDQVLVFCRTKQSAQSVANFLRGNNISSNCIHKDKSQIERNIALKEFKNNKIKALVATDIASRGIDINDLKYVINFDLPNDYESYIHRVGRTARNNKNGVAISFYSVNEIHSLQRIKEKVSEDFIEKNHKYKKID